MAQAIEQVGPTLPPPPASHPSLYPMCRCRYMRDSLMEYARTAVIPLQHGVGRYVRVQLEFDAKWMLVSEVQFDSGTWPPRARCTPKTGRHN